MTTAENTTLEAARLGATGTEPVAGGRAAVVCLPACSGRRYRESAAGGVRLSRIVRREGKGAGVARTAYGWPSCRTDPAESAMAGPPGPAADRAVLFGASRSIPAVTNRQGDTVIAGAGSSGWRSGSHK